MSFVHLRSHSAYSLLKGAIKVPKLVSLARSDNMPALGLVDHDNLFGSLEFSEYAVKEGVQPILGITLSIVPFGVDNHGAANQRAVPDQLLLYAKMRWDMPTCCGWRVWNIRSQHCSKRRWWIMRRWRNTAMA